MHRIDNAQININSRNLTVVWSDKYHLIAYRSFQLPKSGWTTHNSHRVNFCDLVFCFFFISIFNFIVVAAVRVLHAYPVYSLNMFKQKRRAEKVAFYIENETFGFQCANGQTDIVIHGGAVWVNFKVKNVASDFDDHIAEHASSYSLFTQQQKNVLRGAYIDLSDSCAPRRSSNLLNYKSPLNSIRRHLKLKNQSKT